MRAIREGSTIKIESDISYSGESLTIPGLVIVELDPPAVDLIEHLSHLVRENHLYRVERFDASPCWSEFDEDDEGNPIPGVAMRTECDTLSVYDDEIRFSAHPNNSDLEMRSERISIALLKRLMADDA